MVGFRAEIYEQKKDKLIKVIPQKFKIKQFTKTEEVTLKNEIYMLKQKKTDNKSNFMYSFSQLTTFLIQFLGYSNKNNNFNEEQEVNSQVCSFKTFSEQN